MCVGGSACRALGSTCADGDACRGDRFCDPATGRCTPWEGPGAGDHDPDCSRVIVAGTFAPTVQCEFTEAPAGDPFPNHLHVLSTPMVVDFRIGRAPGEPSQPSIVAVFDDGGDGSSELPTGVIRILDGRTCEQQAELGSLQMVSHSSPPALGDLDGDGRPEIVAFKGGGGLVAFRYDESAGAWAVMWRSHRADGSPYDVTGGGWAGPSLYDLNDDGRPEVLRDGIVFAPDGTLLDDSVHWSVHAGAFSVVADADEDGVPELVAGHGVWQWDATASRWQPESWSPGGTSAGLVALADFGAFPGAHGWPDGVPEVVVVRSGGVRVQTLDGTVVFGPVALPGGGSGGPPTVADFDGDGRPEIGVAGASAYSVFDLDCVPALASAECASGSSDGVLWSQRSQDASSNVTGSSVFDFEGDGRAEVVYGDECFLRVYDGRDGTVVFSRRRSSCTWYENPIIADVDGDFNAEIVIGDNYNCGSGTSGRDCSGFGLGPRSTDPLFAGLRCAEDADCISGRCVEGFCRCTSDAECCRGIDCDRGLYVCETPPVGTPGMGNTCRAARPQGSFGLRVYRDTADRWVDSRRIWNQHAYFVTNVEEDGTIPRTSAMRRNWREAGLDNFRQNVQGDRPSGVAPDLTSRADAVVDCAADGGPRLRAMVCNRGAEPVGAGLSVGFYDGDPAAGGSRLCRARTEDVLMPGGCEEVSCVWSDVPRAAPGVTVWVVPDDEDETGECLEGNNTEVVEGVFCPSIG